MSSSVLIILLVVAAFAACRKETPPEPPQPPYVPTVLLDTLAVDVTEVLLRLRATDTSGAAQLALYRDTLLLFAGQPLRGDTTVLDTALAPARLYTYRAYRVQSSQRADSAFLAVRTMDTTSHSFTWQIDTLGDGASSVLYDVAIINDTLAYAVGEIYKRDSLGNWDPNAYNLVRWNGQAWELRRIPFIGPCSAVLYPPLKAIWAFSQNNILVTNGGSIVRYDGTNAVMDCGMNSLLSGAINKIYAPSPQDVYAVGNAGTIVHYNGTTWQRVESGTTLPIQDIWGGRDPSTGEEIILCVASNNFMNQGKKVLRIQANSVVEIPDGGLSWNLSAVWFVPGRKYYIAGDGLYSSRTLGPVWRRDSTSPAIYKDAVRGTGLNDVAVSGSFGLLSHFNGFSWRHFFLSGRYLSVSIQRNTIVAVGWVGQSAVAVRGNR